MGVHEACIDLSILPSVFLLSTHLEDDEYNDIVEQLVKTNAQLTLSAPEARIFLTRIERKRRIEIELRANDVWTKEVNPSRSMSCASSITSSIRKRKRGLASGSDHRRTAEPRSSRSSTEPEHDSPIVPEHKGVDFRTQQARPIEEVEDDMIRVVKVAWLEDSIRRGEILPLSHYLIYVAETCDRAAVENAGERGSRTRTADSRKATTMLPRTTSLPASNATGAAHSQPDVETVGNSIATVSRKRHGRSDTVSSTIVRQEQRPAWKARVTPALVQKSTTEFDQDLTRDLPEPPKWIKLGLKYSCERSTPINGPNDAFIGQLKVIRMARKLTLDEIGVRAYSTAIAAIAAYPYTLTSPREILSIPGCDVKYAALFAEWKNNGERQVQAVQEIDSDTKLKVLKLFHEIWGVGPHTAREFYNKGWRDLDDIVEYGWDDLSRIQQIGLKYYDEFLDKISRAEVEFIESRIGDQMKLLCEPTGVRTCIVGGYRRGKAESGDADIIVSHLDEEETEGLIGSLVSGLTEAGWITHNLIVHTSGTKRDQATRPYNSSGGGHGFDSLDKAMVVWQDRKYTQPGPNGKNPNVHRRVDIIVAPWSKIGCAVLGWSAGTTFERDLRRYAKVVKGWKFDSSGVRDRATGRVVELEARGGVSKTVEEAEKKVFEGMGLVYREPWERCTG